MSSDAQINANRNNARFSTGPTSSSGKKGSRMNAVTHSFAGQMCIIPAHEVAAYEKHFHSFRLEYLPVGPTEDFLVQSLAEYSWSIQQIRAQITNATTIGGARGPAHPDETHTPEFSAAMGQARTMHEFARDFNLYSIYEQRKARMFNVTRKELVQIQEARKAREKAELELAAALRKDDQLHRQPDEPAWHPSQNGFVCSLEEIDTYIAYQKRLERIHGPKKRAA